MVSRPPTTGPRGQGAVTNPRLKPIRGEPRSGTAKAPPTPHPMRRSLQGPPGWEGKSFSRSGGVHAGPESSREQQEPQGGLPAAFGALRSQEPAST
jgi:hypothetical protein